MDQLSKAGYLSDPLSDAEPVPDANCRVCAALGRQREQARRTHDMATVTDCNAEIRRHPHRKGATS